MGLSRASTASFNCVRSCREGLMFCHLLFITGGSKSVVSLEAQCAQLCNGQTRDHALPGYSIHLEVPGQWRGLLVTPKRAHLHHAIPTSFELSPPLPPPRSSQQEALVSCDREALPCEGKLCFGHGHFPVLTESGDSGWGGQVTRFRGEGHCSGNRDS